jgi:predicted Zn-dependent protease with MMP-like domain
MTHEEFEIILEEVLAELPQEFKQHIENVQVLIADEPSREILKQLKASGLFGLYQGVPLLFRNQAYSMTLPDRIIIYRIPIIRAFRTKEKIMRQIKRTLIHEIGHHFGLNETEIREAMGD